MEIPRQIGPYRPLEHLGSGGMGEVYLARAPDGSLLAVKTIRSDLITRPDLRVRLRREAEAMSRVRGEHLAELVAHDLDAEPPYLATRYVQGRSLRDLVTEEGPLPTAALWRLADGLARALVGVHGAGYLHRDLKPANVMVVDGSPVVIDFGISHALDETRLSRHGRASGTPAYMAPELIAEGRAEPAGDVYSWAATVAYAATGRDAHWSALGPVGLAKALFSAETLAPDLRELLDAAFASDPRDRPSAGDLVERLAPLAPVTGADLHLDHPYDAAATTVTLTLPGGRQVVIDLPPNAEAGTTLHFPRQGRLGGNGGSPGILHLHLVSPDQLRSVITSHLPAASREQRSRHVFFLIPVLLILGMVVFAFQIFPEVHKSEGGQVGRIPSPTVSSAKLYSTVPESCRLLKPDRVERLVPGAEIPPPVREDARLSFCDVYKGTRRLHVRLAAVGVAPYIMASKTAERLFQLSLEDEERSPYSQVISQDLGLGDRSFSYMRTGSALVSTLNSKFSAGGYVEMGVEVLMGNVGVRATLHRESEDFADPAKQEALQEQLRGLVGEIVSALPDQAVEVTHSP